MPLEPGKGFVFVSKVVGGTVPREYWNAVEKGVKEAADNGMLAGYPVVDIKATLMTVPIMRSTPLKWPLRLQDPWALRKRKKGKTDHP